MSAIQTMEDVLTSVPTPLDHMCVAVDQDTDLLHTANVVSVSPNVYHFGILKTAIIATILLFPDIDVNECNTYNGGCAQICTNIPGSRVCSCRAGFTLASDGRNCQGSPYY